MLKMNDETYALRRRVMNCIYDAKAELRRFGMQLPRVEVRIVEGGDEFVCGYAYMSSNVVHIVKKFAEANDNMLYHLVLHELLHAVKGVEHDDKCYLMHPTIKRNSNRRKANNAFLSYF